MNTHSPWRRERETTHIKRRRYPLNQSLVGWSDETPHEKGKTMQVKHIRNCSGDSREVYVGRGSALGNDFRQDGEASRTASIKAYRAWLWKKLQAKDARVWQAMRTLKSDSILMCHCHPK